MTRLTPLWVLLTVLVGPLTGGAAVPPLRIMPLGDSITSGCCLTLEGGYRTRLFNLLAAAGYNVDFVGTQISNSNSPYLPDPAHEGHGGADISALDGGIEAWCSAVDDPDIVLLLIGTNDFAGNNDVTHAKNRLENLIAHLATLRPFATIIVSSVLVRTDLPAVDQQIQTLYNPFIPGIVSHQAAMGRHVFYADLRSACGAGDLADGLHPSLAGYNKLADAWFNAITSVVEPNGSSQPPAIARARGQVDLKHVVVTFSKPVEEAAATAGLYSLSGGLSVLGADLDDRTKRTVTLTTSPQSLRTTYQLAVQGVRDRTPQSHSILPNSSANFVSGSVAEAADYSLVYSLPVPNQADFNSTGVPYSIDNRSLVGPFRRVAYYLELQPRGGPLQYVWVSMDAFTADIGKIGVPALGTDAYFQRPVSDLTVQSSLISPLHGVAGTLEFWPGDYSAGNGANIPGARDDTYDWGDRADPGQPGYGSMQVHIPSLRQTVLAYNGWGGAGLVSDLGVGNAPGAHTDWTLAQNAGSYVTRLLEVYAIPEKSASSAPVIDGQPTDLSVAIGEAAVFRVSAHGPGTLSYQWRFNGLPLPGAHGPTYTLASVQASHAGTYDVVVSNSFGATTTGTAVLTLVESSLLSNGSFEAGLAGWMTAGNVMMGFNTPSSQATDGTRLIVYNAGNTPPNGVLLQGVNTTAGQAYQLSFDVGVVAFNQSEQRLNVTAQGAKTLLSRTVSVFGVGNGLQKWVPQSFTFVADSTTTTLTFRDVSPTTLALDLLLDRVRLVSQGPTLRTLTVASSNPHSGAAVRIAPPDSLGRGAGVTGLSRSYAEGTVVVLTAATMANGNTFQKWQRDSVDMGHSARTTLLMDADHTVTAVYVPTRVLTVNASNAPGEVTVRVGPADNNGWGNGVVPFSRLYPDGIPIVLAAPTVVGGRPFRTWLKDGLQLSTSPRLSLILDASSTITAVY